MKIVTTTFIGFDEEESVYDLQNAIQGLDGWVTLSEDGITITEVDE